MITRKGRSGEEGCTEQAKTNMYDVIVTVGKNKCHGGPYIITADLLSSYGSPL